jgi:hypothetical protein
MEKVSPGNCQPIPTDCHHPGYQSLSARSWWCDACMSDCFEDCARDYNCNELSSPLWENATAWCSSTWESSVEDLLEFWHWFKPVCVFMVGGVLSAVFIIVAYYMRGQNADPEICPALDEHRRKEYWAHDTVRANRLYFLEIWKDKLAKAKSLPNNERQIADIEQTISQHYSDLDDAIYRMDDMDRSMPHVNLPGRPWTRQGASPRTFDEQPPSIASTFLPVSMMSSDQH